MDQWRADDGPALPLILPGTNSARIAPWRDPRFRSAVFQGLFAAAVLAVLLFLAWNTAANFARYNIRFGLQFLDRPAGFDILQRLIPYSEASTYGRAFVVAILNTLVLSAAGIVIATVLGFFVGLARLSSNWLVSRLAAIYIETLRNIPLLLQIFFWYFAVLGVMPLPRNSLQPIPGWVYVNNRGLYMPEFQFGAFAGWGIAIGLAVGVVAAIGVSRWARRSEEHTSELQSH